jgi:hypothetical protein
MFFPNRGTSVRCKPNAAEFRGAATPTGYFSNNHASCRDASPDDLDTMLKRDIMRATQELKRAHATLASQSEAAASMPSERSTSGWEERCVGLECEVEVLKDMLSSAEKDAEAERKLAVQRHGENVKLKQQVEEQCRDLASMRYHVCLHTHTFAR